MQVAKNEMILIAIVPEALKDQVVDCLMCESSISGFSLVKIQGFSKEHSHFNVKEQVEGYRDFFRFEILHNQAETSDLLQSLGEISSAKKMRYWTISAHDSGLI